MADTPSRPHIRPLIAALVARRPHVRSHRNAGRVAAPERSRRHVRRFVLVSERLILGSAMSAGLLLIERRLVRSRDARDAKTA